MEPQALKTEAKHSSEMYLPASPNSVTTHKNIDMEDVFVSLTGSNCSVSHQCYYGFSGLQPSLNILNTRPPALGTWLFSRFQVKRLSCWVPYYGLLPIPGLGNWEQPTGQGIFALLQACRTHVSRAAFCPLRCSMRTDSVYKLHNVWLTMLTVSLTSTAHCLHNPV
jgi:hypothetical protein